MNNFKGTGVALVTPFSEIGAIDFNGLKNLLDFTGKHVDYYVVMGTTGEVATCTAEEKTAVLEFCQANKSKNLPIVYGIGGNNTQAVINEIKTSKLSGVDAILSVSPYYNKPSQLGLIAHFTAIADASPVPIILYNVPGRTASNMKTETTLELSKHPNIIGIKEASGDLSQCERIVKESESDFLTISGDDLLSDQIIELGGNGVISVLANGFPKEFCQGINLALDQKFEKSNEALSQLVKINQLMYEESNPTGIKEVLRLKGVCGNAVRLPLLSASESLKERIQVLTENIA